MGGHRAKVSSKYLSQSHKHTEIKYSKFRYSPAGYHRSNLIGTNKQNLNYQGHRFVIPILIAEIHRAPNTQLQENLAADIRDLLNRLQSSKSNFSIYSDCTPSCKLRGQADKRKTKHIVDIMRELDHNNQITLTKLQMSSRKIFDADH